MNGEVYIFGGYQDPKKIAKINDCRIEDTGKKLITSFKGYRGSSVTLKEKIILCNGVDSKCESFDGSSTVPIAETQNGHDRGCMAIKQGRPTIIAGYRSSSVEILEKSWHNAPSHPAGDIYRHTCASIQNGIVTVGGAVSGEGDLNVYLFRNWRWSIVGQMKNYQSYGTMIAYETFFIVFGGKYGANSVERAEWDGNTVTSTEVINDHGGDCTRPIVFEAAPDQCKEFCSEDFCYVN